MSVLTVWRNKEIIKLKQDMERLFAGMYRDFAGEQFVDRFMADSPSVALTETEDAIVVEIEMAGIDPENIELFVAEDYLEISSANRRHVTSNDSRVERNLSFSHRLKLPCRIKPDEVQASHDKDTVKILMPKCSPYPGRRMRLVHT